MPIDNMGIYQASSFDWRLKGVQSSHLANRPI
jgi:hypothetical protein